MSCLFWCCDSVVYLYFFYQNVLIAFCAKLCVTVHVFLHFQCSLANEHCALLVFFSIHRLILRPLFSNIWHWAHRWMWLWLNSFVLLLHFDRLTADWQSIWLVLSQACLSVVCDDRGLRTNGERWLLRSTYGKLISVFQKPQQIWLWITVFKGHKCEPRWIHIYYRTPNFIR